MTRLFQALFCLALAAFTSLPQPPGAQPLSIQSKAVALNEEDPSQTRVGALTYRAGLELTSAYDKFGGLSGLVIARDKSHFIAVTDRAHFICAPLIHDAQGRLSGIGPGWIAPFRGPDNARLQGKQSKDSEAITLSPDGKSAFVTFERAHRVWRYRLDDPTDLCSLMAAQPQQITYGRLFASLPVNGGLESAAALSAEEVITLSEDGMSKKKNHMGWRLSAQNAQPSAFYYASPNPFSPTDMALANKTQLLILHRHFSLLSGVSSALSWIFVEETADNRIIKPRILAQFTPPVTLDNFEGLSVVPKENAGWDVYILSDDNFNLLQRTLLMHFTLPKEALKSD